MKKVLFFLVIIASSILAEEPYQAFVCVPVADCVGEPLAPYYKDKAIGQAYEQLPISWAGEKNSMLNCPRIHQLLFNEQVTVVAQQGNEVLVEIPNMFYEKISSSDRHNKFWTLKKNITPLNKLTYKNPNAVPTTNIEQASMVTLKLPFYDTQTGATYSAGTRFVYTEQKSGYYTVLAFDPQTSTVKHTAISQGICNNFVHKTHNERITDFVNLIRRWVLMPQGIIPLVWGGNSLTKFYHDESFMLKIKQYNDNQISYWQRNEASEGPFTGFDSSGLILRATQICGIPYYYKNTVTAAKNLRQKDQHETIQEGDLLWVPGGLFVISDITHNRMLGVIGYKFGYGKVVELELSQLFRNINTYQELIDRYHAEQPLETKKADGTFSRTIKIYKILKLKSVWE